MSEKMTAAAATALRRPFPAESIGKLPKPYRKESPKGNCPECKGYHGLPAVHLDYVGHAAVTDRLLTVDREWTWRPFTNEEIGALPPPLREAGLWIMLTVCGVTKPGFGDADGKRGGNAVKEMIGDAIRNAAMRFGVSLDLWAKENLVEFQQAISAHREPEERPAPQRPTPPAAEQAVEPEPMQAKQRGALFAAMGEFPELADEDAQRDFLADTLNRAVESRGSLDKDEATRALRRLKAWREGNPAAAWTPKGDEK